MKLFPPQPGRPLVKIGSIRRLLISAARAVGLRHLTHRTFRKLFITKAAEAGLDVEVVVLLVGHEDEGKSIREHYREYRRNYLKRQMNKVIGEYLEIGSPDWVEAQRGKIGPVLESILTAPRKLASPVMDYIHILGEKVAVRDEVAIRRLLSSAPITLLPGTPSDANPSLPRSVPLDEARLVSANLRTLCWRKGLGYNELAIAAGISKSAIYNILTGTRQTSEAMKRIARHLGVSLEDLRNPEAPRYDTELVLNNVKFVVGQFGTGQLPCADTLANVVENRYLPPGNALKRLADAVNIPLHEFLTTDISKRPQLVLQDSWRVRKPTLSNEELEKRRANFAANVRLQLLLAGLSACEASKAAGVTRAQMGNYAAGRSFPPPDTLESLARFFRTTSQQLCGPSLALDAAEIGARIRALVAARKNTPRTTAWKMGLSSDKFVAVVAGKALPNGFQLNAIAKYFGVTPLEILGIENSNESKADGDVPMAA